MSVERLGRFELVSHLASGGMAKVFLARVAGLAGFERHVVLKTLRKEDIPDESYVGMFLDEARLAASLHHQHVAQVYDVGCTSDGTYFLAMEYIHGKTVRSVLESVEDRRLWMPLDFGLSVVAAAAAGLHHAHERCRSDGTPLEIVHRDVSPSNVLVSYDGSIKLIDFGIAKATARVTQTRTGFIKGKAGYMAPEQARGYAVDRRSDVFSLGVLAYELTTQHRAFDAPTEFERVEKIVHGDIIPPSHWVPDYPAELEAIILTALSLDPDDRYQTADEMRLAVEAIAKAENLVLGGASIARLLAMLYGKPLEPWIAPPRSVAKGSGTHDSLVFLPDLVPEPVDESSDITKPLDKEQERELTEAEAIVDHLAERHAAAQRHVAAREAAAADADARSTLSMRNQLPRAGTIKPASRAPDSEPSAPQIVITESSSAPRDMLSARAPSPASESTTREPSSSPRNATSREPSSSPRSASPSQPPPIPAGSPSRSMPATQPPPIPAGALSRSMPVASLDEPPPIPAAAISRSMPAVAPPQTIPAGAPPPIPTGALSRSMPVAALDDPPSFIAQPIASAPLTLDASNAPLTLDDSASVPLLIAVDTPSTPISNYLASSAQAPMPSVPPVTIQPRNRKQPSVQPSTKQASGTRRASTAAKFRRQLLGIIACGAVLGLAIGVTITVLSNDDAPANPPIAAKTLDTKPADKPAAKVVDTKPATKVVDTKSAIAAKTVDASPAIATKAVDTKPAVPADIAKPTSTSANVSAETSARVSAETPAPTRDAPPMPAPHAPSKMATAPIVTPDITESAPSPNGGAQPAVADEVTIHVTTDPSGATVVLDGVRLGTTPFTGVVPAQKREGTLKVRKRGHVAVKTKVDRAADIRWDVKLGTAKR
jgi:serine/threonine protein kinase